jgi:hypothetical protein
MKAQPKNAKPLWTHYRDVVSDSDPMKTWEVKRHLSSGKLGCECPKYRFARGAKTCHHIESALAVGPLAPGQKKSISVGTPSRAFASVPVYTVTSRAIAFSAADI